MAVSGVCSGVLEENSGKVPGKFSESRNTTNLGSVKTGCIAKKGFSSRTFWWGLSDTRSGGFSYIEREKSSNRRAPT